MAACSCHRSSLQIAHARVPFHVLPKVERSEDGVESIKSCPVVDPSFGVLFHAHHEADLVADAAVECPVEFDRMDRFHSAFHLCDLIKGDGSKLLLLRLVVGCRKCAACGARNVCG